MKSFKKTFIVTCLMLLGLTTIQAEDTTSCPSESVSNFKLGVAAVYDSSEDDFVPEIHGLFWNYIEAGVGANYENIKFRNGKDFKISGIFYNLGFRMDLYKKLSGSLGFIGANGITGGEARSHGFLFEKPYLLGVYLGLNYELNRACELFVRILPYNFVKYGRGSVQANQYLVSGQIGLAWYLFN